MATADQTVAIEYLGPIGQESPLFGPLVAGERYQCDAELAAYLVRQHPDYWRRPPMKPAPAPAEE